MYLHLSFASGATQGVNIPAITNKHDLEDYLESTGPLWVTDDRNVYWNLSQCIRIDLMPEHFKKSPRPIS